MTNKKPPNWRPIETFDRNKSSFVLVTEDGAVRLLLWTASQQRWEYPDVSGAVVVKGWAPTHWMPCPNAPENSP